MFYPKFILGRELYISSRDIVYLCLAFRYPRWTHHGHVVLIVSFSKLLNYLSFILGLNDRYVQNYLSANICTLHYNGSIVIHIKLVMGKLCLVRALKKVSNYSFILGLRADMHEFFSAKYNMFEFSKCKM